MGFRARISNLVVLLMVLGAFGSQTARSGPSPIPQSFGLGENVWRPYAFERSPPRFPGPFESMANFEEDAYVAREISLAFLKFKPSSGGGPMAKEPYTLVIPAGTRLTRTSVGLGSSIYPRSQFLMMTLKLDPCPEGFPTGGYVVQAPKEHYDVLLFSIHHQDSTISKGCELYIQFFRPRIRDRESLKFVNSLEFIPRGAPIPIVRGGAEGKSVEDGRLESGKISESDIISGTPPADASKPSSSSGE